MIERGLSITIFMLIISLSAASPKIIGLVIAFALIYVFIQELGR